MATTKTQTTKPVLNLKNDDPVSDHEMETNPAFKKMQGNILKGHGRDNSVNIFLRFRTPRKADVQHFEQLKAAIARLTAKYVTTAYQQFRETRQFQQFKIPGRLFGNLFLSANGYRKLGHKEADLKKWFKDEDKFGVPANAVDFFALESSFLGGMRKAAADLGDIPRNFQNINLNKLDFRLSPIQKRFLKDKKKIDEEVILDPLEAAYYEENIHALLLLADDDKDGLLRETRALINDLEQEGLIDIAAVEIGQALRNADDEGIEHFGYVDGRSQPLYLASDFTGLKKGKIVPGSSKEKINEKAIRKEGGDITVWNPFEKLEMVLRPDISVKDPEAYGSFFVFRKLEQDVLRFSIAEQQLADDLKLSGTDRERAGAMIVGRFRDGSPLVLSGTDSYIPSKENNFRYDGRGDDGTKNSSHADTLGLKCPFHAHIRKTSPRENSGKGETTDRGRRITRRGIPYGDRNKHPNAFQSLDELPTGDVGLLFACFQESIVTQYAFMQKTWANNVGFKNTGTGLDPIIGQPFDKLATSRPEQHWRADYGNPKNEKQPAKADISKTHTFDKRIDNFVQFRGGEFFFAPSTTYLLQVK